MSLSPELRSRVITGIAGGALLLSLLGFGGWPGVFIVTLIITLAMVHEFASMSLALPDRVEKRYLMLCLAWVIDVAELALPGLAFETLIFCFIVLFAFYLLTARKHAREPVTFERHLRELALSVFGIVYVGFLPSFLLRVHGTVGGVRWVLAFLFMVWANDIGAYFVGRKYGRRRLYPEISPKKSVEGAGGGLLAGVLVTVIFKLAAFPAMPWVGAIFIPIFVGATAQVGDLCESFIKRVFDKKDSSSVLPGHGGFLDRFDGIVFSLPVMYACIRVFGF